MRRSWSDSFAILVSSFKSEKCVTFVSWQSAKLIKTICFSDQVAKHHSTQKKFSLKRLFRIKGQSTTNSTPGPPVTDELRKDDEYLNFRTFFARTKIIIFFVKEKLTKTALMFNWNNTVRNRGLYFTVLTVLETKILTRYWKPLDIEETGRSLPDWNWPLKIVYRVGSSPRWWYN